MSSTEHSAILKLGRKMADALDASDLAGRWMAHHLADLIHQSESAPEDELLASATREAILQFWAHKAGAPFRRRPFENLDAVFAALERLEPDPPPWAYYRTFSETSNPSPAALTTYPLLPAAIELERITAEVVGFTVAVVGSDAIDLEEDWVVTATAIADTKRDHATRLLQRAVRRMRQLAQRDPRELLVVDPSSPDEPFDATEYEGIADGESDSIAEEVEDPLRVALLAAITSCRLALDTLEANTRQVEN
ncbi:hypothetical protein [Nocardioides xinjiangensis]|uniref:hypothetical protein n=1 Tax=Nocardioides xinjiangensis TaxID=2817376 RepID=UPI001B30E546|nr:hypothetical protein [Nocardioides sp. SYSU D00778]